jgi:hypothetical protein
VNNVALFLISTSLIGLGATLIFDLWSLFLKQAFKITPSNICLVGRWLRTMPEGVFRLSNIASAPQKSAECAVGWIPHYLIGVIFAIMQPAFGLGLAASKTANPTQARLRSLMNDSAFPGPARHRIASPSVASGRAGVVSAFTCSVCWLAGCYRYLRNRVFDMERRL